MCLNRCICISNISIKGIHIGPIDSPVVLLGYNSYHKFIIKYNKLSNIYPVPMYLHLDISEKCNDPDNNIDIMLVDTPYSGGGGDCFEYH